MKSSDMIYAGGITRLQAVSLGVSNFQKSVNFYQRVLGLEVEVMAPGHYESISRVNISLVSSGDAIASQGFHIELVVDNVDAWYKDLQTQEVPLLTEPQTQPWGARNFYLLDPEGHKLELTT